MIVTLIKQVYKQWKEGKSEGVSKWLYVGQMTASVGFAVYSFLLWNPVFIFTNSLLVINAIVGLLVNLHLKRKEENAA